MQPEISKLYLGTKTVLNSEKPILPMGVSILNLPDTLLGRLADHTDWAKDQVLKETIEGVSYPIMKIVENIHTAEDAINHPVHYNQGDIECIDAIKSMLGKDGFIAYLRGNIAKYNWRLLHKGKALSDAQKLGWYQNRLEQELRDDSKVSSAETKNGQ
jgi:hypothetical protein